MFESDYKLYDSVVSYLIQDGMANMKDGNIGLANFDPNNKEHMLVFYCYLYGASLMMRKVSVNLGGIEYLAFRIRHNDMKRWYNNDENKKNINIEDAIRAVYSKVPGTILLTDGLGCIYDEYYSSKKGKK